MRAAFAQADNDKFSQVFEQTSAVSNAVECDAPNI
eukprot:CAMPEP_0206607378 /NCGR_PEP_ID=MMETSP0325_2-20121206/52105_1 /ASSEMBLY_ACC=CAM_ASM_000347 /TAXON_ID=2866 /ORGANISM="Crypthecodinium cohnii, Strain Seligo" /LENGTH=34 /DNA_ID= /DNA_START= /DNA_END= /DNA_ORIENTATION=